MHDAKRQMHVQTPKRVPHTCTSVHTLAQTHTNTHTHTHTPGSLSWHPQSVTAKTQRTSSSSQEGRDSTLSSAEFELIKTDNDRLPAMTEIFFTFTYFTVEDISFVWLEAWKREFVLVGKYRSCLITHHGTEAQVWIDRQLRVTQPYLWTIITWTIKIFISTVIALILVHRKCRKRLHYHNRSALWATSYLMIRKIMNI